jgi:hypothetical protein
MQTITQRERSNSPEDRIPVTVRLDVQLARKAKSQAALEGQSLRDLVAMALSEYLAKRRAA